MAVTVATVFQGVDTFIADVTFGVNTDNTSAATAHGLGATPVEVYYTVTTGGTSATDYALAVTSSTFTLSKSLVAAGATGVVRVILKRPHSTGR